MVGVLGFVIIWRDVGLVLILILVGLVFILIFVVLLLIWKCDGLLDWVIVLLFLGKGFGLMCLLKVNK